MLQIAALILTDDNRDRFLGIDLNERAALVAHDAGIDHCFFVGRNLPDLAMLSRLRARGIFATGLLEWPVIFAGVPAAERLVVLPARTVMEPEGLRTILRNADEDRSRAALVVIQGPQRKNSIISIEPDGLVSSVMGDGNAMSTGVAIIPRHLFARVATVWSVHDAVHRLAKADQLRALASGTFYCRPLEAKGDVAAAEREFRWRGATTVWQSLLSWRHRGNLITVDKMNWRSLADRLKAESI